MDSNREIKGSVKIEDSKIVLKMNGLEQVYVKTNVANPKEWIVFLDSRWVLESLLSQTEDDDDFENFDSED